MTAAWSSIVQAARASLELWPGRGRRPPADGVTDGARAAQAP